MHIYLVCTHIRYTRASVATSRLTQLWRIATFGQNKPRCLDWLKLKSNFFGSILFFLILTEFSMVIVLEGKSTFFPYKFIHFLTLSVTIGEWQVQINDAGMER
jgi:hypothetical protein